MRLHLRGLPGPIDFGPDTGETADMLASVLVGWPTASAGSGGSPLIAVERSGDDIRVARADAAWSTLEPTEVSAVCTLVVEIVAAFVAAHGGLGSLHAAAVEFSGRLALFPSTHRAGKSTLAAAFAASGRRIFADDLIAIDLATGDGVATGCLPRLRLPLPPCAGEALRDHVARNTVASDGYYAYLTHQADAVVPHGARAPIGAVVLLDRSDDDAAVDIASIPVEDALTALLVQNTHGALAADAALDGYLGLLGNAPAFRIRYSSLDDAVAALDALFSTWPDPKTSAPDLAATATAPPTQAALPAWLSPSAGASLYRRNPSIAVRHVGDSGFLFDGADNQIHRLNAIGLGLWNLLATPIDVETIVGVFSGAFPDIDRDSIENDVTALLDDLLAKRLVERDGN